MEADRMYRLVERHTGMQKAQIDDMGFANAVLMWERSYLERMWLAREALKSVDRLIYSMVFSFAFYDGEYNDLRECLNFINEGNEIPAEFFEWT